MKKTKMITLLSLLVGGAASGAPTGPELPKEVKTMDCLVGKWNGAVTMKVGDSSTGVKMTWDCRHASGNFGVQCKAEMTGIPGMKLYQETDLFGYDPGAKKYHWFSVTNGGETHDHQAPIPEGNVIEFVYDGLQEGKPFKEVIKMSFGADEKSMDFSSETFVEGKSTALMQGKASKK